MNQAFIQKIIPDALKDNLREYLYFRHFFTHAYALDLYAHRMKKLVDNVEPIYAHFKREIERFTKNRPE